MSQLDKIVLVVQETKSETKWVLLTPARCSKWYASMNYFGSNLVHNLH